MPFCSCPGAGAMRGVLLLVLALTGAGPAQPAGETPLTVVTWGGAYEAAQRAALFGPFTRQTGTPLRVLRYSGGIKALRRRAEPEGWDVVDMLEDDAMAACAAGLLWPLDHEALLSPAGGVPAEADFAPLRLGRCSVPQNVYARVIAYDDRAFPGVKPTRLEDFFDIERFPGKRAVERSPDGILEWALMAEGVPPSQIYDLLSTERGLRLAFRRLDTIRDSIVWWEDPAQPARWLSEGKVAMATGYNGRFFAEALSGAPVTTIWDGRLIGVEVWAMPAGADTGPAQAFLSFAARPERMAALAERIPYGPARRSALPRIGLHPDAAIPMRDYLPNARPGRGRALHRDSRWYSNTAELRRRHFRDWLRDGK